MERKLSQKELRFLKEFESLLSRNGVVVTILNKRVTFFIDNAEEGECVPVAPLICSDSLTRLIKKGTVNLDWDHSQMKYYNDSIENMGDEPVKETTYSSHELLKENILRETLNLSQKARCGDVVQKNRKTRIKEFKRASEPLMKYLAENCHPHTIAIVDIDRSILWEGEMCV